MIRSTARICVSWVMLAALYALFAGEVSVTEAVAGVLATSIGVAYGALLHRSRSRPLTVWAAPWPRIAARSLASLAQDAWRVGRVLLRVLRQRPDGPVGMRSRQAFRAGEPDARDAGRRGVVTLGLSLAPNGYVLDIEPDAIVLHRLEAAAPSLDREWPV